MGLTVSVDKAGFPKLGYDRVYLNRDGWSQKFKSANAVDEAVAPHNWEKRKERNVVHKGFSAGVRQFTILCDVCDASYGITWLVDASKGIEYVKAVLALEFGLVRTELELAFPPDNDNINNNKLVICGKDCDLVGSSTPRFCVLLKDQVRDLFQVVCVDRYGAFRIYRTLSESDESFFLKVLKLRGLRITASALIPRANHWPSYNKALFLRGNYVCWQVRDDEARIACDLGNYATSLLF